MRHISTFSYLTVSDWNCLPSSVMLSNSVNCFKSGLNYVCREHPLKFNADCFLFSCVFNTKVAEVIVIIIIVIVTRH